MSKFTEWSSLLGIPTWVLFVVAGVVGLIALKMLL